MEFSFFGFFKIFFCFQICRLEDDCLVTNAVAVLLDGLDEGLDDGGLGDLTDWGKSIGSGCGGSNGNGGSGGVGKRSSGVGKRGSGVSERSSGDSGVAETGEDGRLSGDDEDGKNNLEMERMNIINIEKKKVSGFFHV
jgi:hypothetical protein